MFALKQKSSGLLVGFSTRSNEGSDFCVDTRFELEVGAWVDNIWTTTSRELAEGVAITNTEWYNAGYNSPVNEFVGDLEVVELVVKV